MTFHAYVEALPVMPAAFFLSRFLGGGFSGAIFIAFCWLNPCFIRGGRLLVNIFKKNLKQPATATITITKVL